MIEFPSVAVVTLDACTDGLTCGIYPTMQSFCCVPLLAVHWDDGISDRALIVINLRPTIA